MLTFPSWVFRTQPFLFLNGLKIGILSAPSHYQGCSGYNLIMKLVEIITLSAAIVLHSTPAFGANEVSSPNSSSLIEDKFEHLIKRIDCLTNELSNDPAFDKARCSNFSEGNISEAQPHQAESDPETKPPGEPEFKIGESYYHLHPLTRR